MPAVSVSSVFFDGFPAAPRIKLKAKSAIVMNDGQRQDPVRKKSRQAHAAGFPDEDSIPLPCTRGNPKGKINPADRVKISVNAQITGGSSMYLVDETEISIEDLIKGMAIISANDACVAVAEHLGGSVNNFVKMMNTKARALEMKHSHFINPNGLPAKGQVSTARDILKLSRAYIRNFPEALRLHSMQEYTYTKGITQHNNNSLLKQSADVDGLKTGFVRAAGFHLVATAKRGNTRLIAVVMGEKNPKIRARETAKLLEQGFRMIGGKGKKSPSLKKIS